MSQFEKDLIQTIQTTVLKEIKNNTFLRLQYDQKKMLPDGVLERIWESVNWEEVIEQIRPEIQKRICNTVIGAMETEIKPDVKALLSVSGVREKLRMDVYPQLMKVLNNN